MYRNTLGCHLSLQGKKNISHQRGKGKSLTQICSLRWEYVSSQDELPTSTAYYFNASASDCFRSISAPPKIQRATFPKIPNGGLGHLIFSGRFHNYHPLLHALLGICILHQTKTWKTLRTKTHTLLTFPYYTYKKRTSFARGN